MKSLRDRSGLRVAVMQPYFFPYIGYFELISVADRFVFLDDVQFIRRGWIHRNRILLRGAAHPFTVPVRDSGQSVRICDVAIAESQWRRKLLATLRHAYARAPHFAEGFDLARSVILSETNGMGALAKASVELVCQRLGIRSRIVESSRVYGNSDLHGQERIVDIAIREGASDYFNAPGGRALYDPAAFEAAGIRLWFLEPPTLEYSQGGSDFVPNLSILDALMWKPADELAAYLQSRAALVRARTT